MLRSKELSGGTTHTVESYWNASAIAFFRLPKGAKINVKYGIGRFSINRQEQILDGATYKKLSVAKGSVVLARMRVKVPQTTVVDYDVYLGGVSQQFPEQRF
jgi:hypothetical protein